MKKLLYLSMLLLFVLTGCTEEKKEFTVLQWNIWQEGTMIPGGYDAMIRLEGAREVRSPAPRGHELHEGQGQCSALSP